jgi:branched-subunit amino acid aminotransferase/4-amino-4-deoxychorismate lyase
MRKILTWASINGQTAKKENALIPAFDNGFLNGHGIFTTIKVRDGYPLFFDRHLNRLKTSSQELDIPTPTNLENSLSAVISKNKLTNGGVRVTISSTTTFIHAFTMDNQIQKVDVITTPETRDKNKTIKTTYRVPNIFAQKKAQAKGAQDALFTTQKNQLIESTYANIYAYTPDNTIITPPIEGKGLNGISRQILMENLPIQEKEIPADTTDPIILVSSLSLRIVESINGKKIKQDPEFIELMSQAIDNAEKSYISSHEI